jgi:hypothetical protein
MVNDQDQFANWIYVTCSDVNPAIVGDYRPEIPVHISKCGRSICSCPSQIKFTRIAIGPIFNATSIESTRALVDGLVDMWMCFGA